jgi:hypothetical protein
MLKQVCIIVIPPAEAGGHLSGSSPYNPRLQAGVSGHSETGFSHHAVHAADHVAAYAHGAVIHDTLVL